MHSNSVQKIERQPTDLKRKLQKKIRRKLICKTIKNNKDRNSNNKTYRNGKKKALNQFDWL